MNTLKDSQTWTLTSSIWLVAWAITDVKVCSTTGTDRATVFPSRPVAIGAANTWAMEPKERAATARRVKNIVISEKKGVWLGKCKECGADEFRG